MKVKQGDRVYDYGTIECRHHLEARRSSDLKSKSGLWKQGELFRPVISLLHSQFNACVEGTDFDLSASGDVKFRL